MDVSNCMKTSQIIKLRIIFILLTGFLFFIGSQVVPVDTTGVPMSFFEALGITVLLLALHFIMWSDYMHNKFAEDGLKINYKLYQIIGLTVVLGMLAIIVNTYYIEHIFK